MRGLQKSKRLSWASDVNLCQVRLFLSEESPSQVGLGAQDHLQAKSSWQSHSAGAASNEFLPPGFEGGHSANHLQITVSEIPAIKWRCPPRFVLNFAWQVVAGEESKEVEVQNQREMRVLEAVYPRPSAIPTNPAVSADIVETQQADHHLPLIPITAIEDEDAGDALADFMGQIHIPVSSHPQPTPQYVIQNAMINEKPAIGLVPGSEPDMVASASAAFAAFNKGNEQGSLIDHDLLVKILNNPNVIEKLITDYGTASNAQSISKPSASFTPVSNPPPLAVNLPKPSNMNMNRTEPPPSSLTATPDGPFYPRPTGVGPGIHPNSRVPPSPVPASSSCAPTGAPPVKDVNYYKNLIQQHGGDRQETSQLQQFGGRYGHQPGTNQELVNHKMRDSRPKIMKPCIYFNSSRGCRHGANCAYQHDASSQQRGSSIPEVQSAKRMKVDGEISS